MMKFSSPDETACAMALTLRYLPALLQAFEKGIAGRGLTILERSQFLDPSGSACPVLVIHGKRLRFRLELRHAFEELLTLDREETPPRVDRRLAEDPYGRSKLADIVSGRLAIVSALEESRDVREAQERLGELGKRFEWLKAVFVEDPEGDLST